MKIGINLNFFYVVKFDGFDAQTELTLIGMRLGTLTPL